MDSKSDIWDEEDIVNKLIEIAREMGIDDAGFIEYLMLHELEEKEKYPAQDVFVTLLGRVHRAYQYWEKDPDYPVKKPAREPIAPTGVMGRVYTPKQVVQIAWWWWENCAIEKRGRKEKRGGE